jgi:hypothetical protein
LDAICSSENSEFGMVTPLLGNNFMLVMVSSFLNVSLLLDYSSLICYFLPLSLLGHRTHFVP